jgi:hypothetical protein
MTLEMWLGIARHLLTALGGVLVTKGWADEASVQAGIGALITIGGVAWSVVAKKK